MKISKEHVQKISEILDQGLSYGLGRPIPGQMCVEAAVCYAFGENHHDEPTCVDDTINTFGIWLNDMAWTNKSARGHGMKRFAIAQLGTTGHQRIGSNFSNEMKVEVLGYILNQVLDSHIASKKTPSEVRLQLKALKKCISKARSKDARINSFEEAAKFVERLLSRPEYYKFIQYHHVNDVLENRMSYQAVVESFIKGFYGLKIKGSQKNIHLTAVANIAADILKKHKTQGSRFLKLVE